MPTVNLNPKMISSVSIKSSIMFLIFICLLKPQARSQNICFPTPVPFIFGGRLDSGATVIEAFAYTYGDIIFGGYTEDDNMLPSFSWTIPILARIESGGDLLWQKYIPVGSSGGSVKALTYAQNGISVAIVSTILIILRVDDDGNRLYGYDDSSTFTFSSIPIIHNSNIHYDLCSKATPGIYCTFASYTSPDNTWVLFIVSEFGSARVFESTNSEAEYPGAVISHSQGIIAAGSQDYGATFDMHPFVAGIQCTIGGPTLYTITCTNPWNYDIQGAEDRYMSQLALSGDESILLACSERTDNLEHIGLHKVGLDSNFDLDHTSSSYYYSSRQYRYCYDLEFMGPEQEKFYILAVESSPLITLAIIDLLTAKIEIIRQINDNLVENFPVTYYVGMILGDVGYAYYAGTFQPTDASSAKIQYAALGQIGIIMSTNPSQRCVSISDSNYAPALLQNYAVALTEYTGNIVAGSPGLGGNNPGFTDFSHQHDNSLCISTAHVVTVPSVLSTYEICQSESFDLDLEITAPGCYDDDLDHVITSDTVPVTIVTTPVYLTDLEVPHIYVDSGTTSGTYLIDVTSTAADGQEDSLSFNLVVKSAQDCDCATITCDDSLSHESLMYGEQFFKNFEYTSSSSNECTVTITLTQNSGASISFDSQAIAYNGRYATLSLEKSSSIDIDSYEIEVSGTLDNGNTCSYIYQFQVTQCEITVPDIANYTFQIDVEYGPIVITKFTDPTEYSCLFISHNFRLDDGSSLNPDLFQITRSNDKFKLLVNTQNTSYIGQYNMEIEVEYQEHIYFAQFIIDLKCNLFTFTETTINDVYYTVGNEQLELAFQEFDQYPNCGNHIYYIAKLSEGEDLPDFISFSSTERKFSIYSNNNDSVGEYSIIVIAVSYDQDGTIHSNSNLQFNVYIESTSNKNYQNQTEEEDNQDQIDDLIDEILENITNPDLQRNFVYASVYSFDNYGFLTVQFSDQLFIPSNVSMINSSVLEIHIESRSYDIDDTMLDLQWEIEAFSVSQMKINLQFENPLYVSQIKVNIALTTTE